MAKAKTKSNASGTRSVGNNTLAAPFVDACIKATVNGDMRTIKKLGRYAKKYRRAFSADFVHTNGKSNGAVPIKTRDGLDALANGLSEEDYAELRTLCLEVRDS